MDKIRNIPQLNGLKGKIGLVTGVFDILHFEHIEFLSFAKKKVDILIVGLESDENVKLFKGKGRPIFKFKERAAVLSSLEFVDFIFKVPDIKKDKTMPDFYKEVVGRVNPDILFSAVRADDSWKQKKKKAEELGIRFISYDKKPTVSSSKIISMIS